MLAAALNLLPRPSYDALPQAHPDVEAMVEALWGVPRCKGRLE